MDAKLICLVALAIIGFTSLADSKPTCAEPTCGGTLAAPGAGGEDGEEGEEEDVNCSKNPFSSWLNFFAWSTFCTDGTIGATQNPIGKIGKPAEEDVV